MFLRRAVGQFPKKILSGQKVLEKNDARDAEAMGKKYSAFYYPGAF